jgi:hypothetical protein
MALPPAKRPLRWVLAAAAAAQLLPAGVIRAESGPALESVYEGYRVEAAGTLEGPPDRVMLLPPRQAGAWPEEVRRALEERVVAEWDERLHYGVVSPGVGAELEYPLVTAQIGGRVAVPVVEGNELPIRGSLDVLFGLAKRRVALLVDTSSSTNAGRGSAEASERRESAWKAEWRAVDRLLEVAEREPLDVAVIAFGRQARAVVAPETPAADARRTVHQHRRDHPRGHGRTDAICALWMGRDWLERAPEDASKHLVLMTDGAEPDSGRFPGCDLARRLGPVTEWVCELTRNRRECPATHALDPREGRTDWDQVENFAEELPEHIAFHALLFGEGSDAARYELMADRAGGESASVLGPASLDSALLDLIGHRVGGVFATNETTGEKTRDLLADDGLRFDGRLGLRSGANDVLLRIERRDGQPTVFRFRVYAEPDLRRNYLAELRERNSELERERSRLVAEAKGHLSRRASERDLIIRPE